VTTLTISAKSHPYRVTEQADVAAAVAAVESPSDAFWLVDARVADLHGDAIGAARIADRTFRLEASEQAKSYAAIQPVFEWLLGAGCRRSSQLVVIGGGVLQDIGCFVASVLMRGLRWTLIPTTLLAQCDSCIGSKSSINVGRYKNQLGTFYPPHEVLLAFDFLATLTEDEIHSGLGEAIKLHMIAGPEETARLRATLEGNGRLAGVLPGVVWDSLRIKKRFIEEDEFDHGVRNLLNYGHTFAHAFESATRYEIPHGIAVIMGVVCAASFAEQLGLAPPGSFADRRDWLRPYYARFAAALHRASPADILAAFRQDKKNSSGKVTFVLGEGPGSLQRVSLAGGEIPPLLEACLQAV